jgi:hypothetical protein
MWSAAVDAITRSGRRRSRKERAAHATELLASWSALRDTFDTLDGDMYLALSRNEDAQGQMLAVIAAGAS